MKIANKISLSFMVVVVILATIASSIFYVRAKNYLRDAVDELLITTASSRAKHIETFLELQKENVLNLSESVVVKNLLMADKKSPDYYEKFNMALKRLKSTRVALRDIYEIFVLDKNGRIIVSSDETKIGLDRYKDAYFLGALAGPPYIKDAYHSEITGKNSLDISTPIFQNAETTERLGVLVCRVGLDGLNEITLDRAGLGKTGEVYVVNKYSYMVTPSIYKKDTFLKQKVETDNVKNGQAISIREKIPENGEIFGVYEDYRGVKVLGAHAHIPELKWLVVAEIDVKEAFSHLAVIRLIFLLTLIIVPITAWLLGIFVAAAITGPLLKLQKGIGIIGRGDLDYKVGTAANDEVGQLSRAFDSMTGDLKKTTTSVEKLNREIAERKKIEDRLRESEEWLSVTLGSIGDGVIATDLNGRIAFLNKVAENLTGWIQKEAHGKDLMDIFKIVNEQSLKEVANPVEKVLKSGKIVGIGNHTILIAKDGTRLPIDDSAAPIKDKEGETIGAVLVFRDVSARRKMENELRRLAAIVEFSDDAIIGKTLDGIIFSWNKGAEKIYGYKAEEIIGKHISMLAPQEHKNEISDILEKIKQGEKVERFETVRFTKDGREMHVSLTVSAIADNSGNIIGASTIARDITQEKRDRELIHESEERFRQLFESSRDAIMILGKEGFTDCNSMTLELFGINRKEDFVKKQPFELSPSSQPDGNDSLSASNEHIEKAFRDGSDFFEWEHRKQDGTVFPAEVLLSKFLLGGKEFLQATVRDITQRKDAERRINEGLEEWERTFNAISDLIFIQDDDYNILRVNSALCQALKLKPEEIIGKKCFTVLHKLTYPWPGCPSEQTHNDHAPHQIEVDDPQIGVPLLVSTSPIFDDKGKFIGVVHIAKDISDRKKIENALRETVEIKTNFTSTVSHELRTPLAAIKEGISLVLDGTAGEVNKNQEEFLSIAKKNVDRLGRLINDILDFQKLESGKMVFNMQLNDVNEAVKEARQSMLSLAEQKNLDFTLQLDEDLPKVQFDRDKIIQVLVNLVNNSIKFSEKGSINIRTARQNDFVKVSVSDTGPGIKEEDIPVLFEKFKQLDTGLGRKTGGTGLGLSICKEIIGKHKGNIWAESKFGEGSTFSFTLPIT